MIHKIEIPTSIIESSIDLSISRGSASRGDFFHEIREAFKKNLEEIFISNGVNVNSIGSLGYTNYFKNSVHQKWKPITKWTGSKNDIKQELDLYFCSKYGHEDYSLSAINYTDRTPASLPALSSLSGIFSIGNILVLVENENYDLEVTLADGINSTGYAYHISKRKKKSYFCLFGIWFNPELINSIIDFKLKEYKNSKEDLDEIKLGTISYPILYINRITGELSTCSCFEGYFNVANDIERLLPYGNSEEGLRNRIREIKTLNGICNFCTGGIPRHEYGSPMYYSSFLQRYLPYHKLLSQMKHGKPIYEGEEFRNLENELRERFGYPKIGQQWVTETTLYKFVCMLFPDYEVIHHYRGKELKGLELDIWLPELKLGIEYQGEQHYNVIEHWGGKAGLEKRIQNDKKKKSICNDLNYHLIEIKYTEEISEQLIKKRIGQFM